MSGRDASVERSVVARKFLSEFASGIHSSLSEQDAPSPSKLVTPPQRRRPKRRLRPIALANEPTAQNNGFREESDEDQTHLPSPHNAHHDESTKLSLSFMTHSPRIESPFLRTLQKASTPSETQTAQSPARTTDFNPTASEHHSSLHFRQYKAISEKQSSPGRPEQQLDGAWSDDLQNQAIIHATHIRAVVNEPALFLEALQALYYLSHSPSSNSADHNASPPVHRTSKATRSMYCQAVFRQLSDILHTFPIPIQRALNLSTKASEFPQPCARTWLPPHPSHLSFRLLREEANDAKPVTHRLKTNLEGAWDALLDMLRTYCGHKKEAAGSFDEGKAVGLITSLHPCNTDIFASRFVNLLSTHTINAQQQSSHIRLLDKRIQAQSKSPHAAKDTGVILHRVPQCVLAAFGDIPAHKFFARFLTGIDSARLSAALWPRFLARVWQALSKASSVNSNHEFCDVVLEARLYARFLAVMMHAVNWSHSPFAISSSLSVHDTSVPEKKRPGKEDISYSETPRTDKPHLHNNKEQPRERKRKEEAGKPEKASPSRKKLQNHTKSISTEETPGLGSNALQWRAWHLSAFWKSFFNIDEVITSAVSSNQTTAVIAAAAVAEVLLKFAAVDPVAESSVWFQDGLSAMRKLHVSDRSTEVQMPFVQFLKNDLLTCDEIGERYSNLQENQGIDESYVLHCDAGEWSAIGNMRLVQECCRSLACFRKNLAECSDTNLQKTASRRITPRMTGSITTPSPFRNRTVLKTRGIMDQEGQEEENPQPTQEQFRKEFLSRLDSRLLELIQIVITSRPESEEDARRKYLRVAKILYSDVPVTVRAVAAHVCGHQLGCRLRPNMVNQSLGSAEKVVRGDSDVANAKE
ncbi:unnamed protein product [Agarophyton chilense]|eukprot:gb/GEZJ01000756.1/.p2 GENE.gb/GEZJ01000756.1/~~gb/GEZJ01000756.1/.p2  ORF type:complete len:867 (+),score=115.89 gb/GEZJ01000756.1/:7580-10180(+)